MSIIKKCVWAILGVHLLVLTGCSKPDSNTLQQANVDLPNEIILYDFETAELSSDAIERNINIQLTNKAGVSQGKQALKLNFDAKSEHSAVDFIPSSPWNFEPLGNMNIAFDASNTGRESVQLFVKVTDKHNQVHNRSISVPVGASDTYYIDLSGEQINVDSGLRADPSAWPSDEFRMPYMSGPKQLELSAIKQISFSIWTNLVNKEIVIDNIRARTNPQLDPNYLTGLVDKFGQAAKKDYPNKVKSEAHLKQLADEELADLAANPVLSDRSSFGGWKNGPKLDATGYFRTTKINGKWALVDPEGYLFFSSGIANIRIANTTTFTGIDFKDDAVRYRDPEDVTPEDSLGIKPVSAEAQKTSYVSSHVRRDMFTWLPNYDDALGKHYSYRRSTRLGPLSQGETYSFYQANLERRYGERYPESFIDDWQDVTIKRMRSWGMTSFGNWVDESFYQKNEFPYFANGWIIGDFKTVTSDGHGWSPMPDPYDPEFARRARVTVEVVAQEVKDNPWCIGVFIDNEKSWGNPKSLNSHYRVPVQNFLMDAKDSPAKQVFMAMMQEKYTKIEALNAAWGIDFSSWQAFAEPFEIKQVSEKMVPDLSVILEAYITQYFKVVQAELKKVMPNHLYMGVRMAAWSINPEGVRAAKKYVDVMSYNYYREAMHDVVWNFLPEVDMPSIIGEYHIGAMDTGLYHPGLIQAADQKDRARMYTNYLEQVIDDPYMVGAHWFQYTDSPITGRAYDGENYNIGFVTNADVPYMEMVEASRKLNRDLYPRRFGTDQEHD